jgi:predicted membrane GTPase involved in stress response
MRMRETSDETRRARRKVTNVRAAGKDEHIDLVPPIRPTLAYAIEFIADDERVEITPRNIRLRKRHLKEHDCGRGEEAPRRRRRAPPSGGGTCSGRPHMGT